MWQRTIRFVVFLLALVGVARSSEAGLLEYIWQLSGPTMFGSAVGCSFTVHMEVEDCRAGARVEKNPTWMDRHGPFVYLGGEYLFSVPLRGDSGWFDVNMLGFQPAVLFRSYGETADPDRTTHRWYHGAGISYDVVFGKDFRRFTKLALTVTVAEYDYKKWGFGFKVRVYPDRFNPEDDFSGKPTGGSRPREVTYGASITYIFSPKQPR